MDGVSLLKRLLGVLLALAGLVPLIAGSWLAIRLGPSGTARFTLPDPGSVPVLVSPSVLNRTDLDVRIAVEAPDAVIGVGTPSDVASVLRSAEHRAVTGVQLPGWDLATRTEGSGPASRLGDIELWRDRQQIAGSGELTITQATAPESVLIVPGASPLKSVTMSWAHDTWFYQALVLAAAGGLLTTVGWLLARPARRPRPAASQSITVSGSTTEEER
ncbi:hypothetical protein [Nostocoides veronense]|uniref:Uncharacterized protein n=1 Tax=Nostocoides veronense TaxID=330836 RepID=A0ABP4XZ09_9MICO